MPSTTPSAIVRPSDPALAAALRLALLFAAVKFALHLAANLWQAHIGWGYFRDEFYYIACGRHLAWGYVDHGPLVALQARLATTVFGNSLAGTRVLSALGGAARVFLTGLLTWALGGRRGAQVLAMLAVLFGPMYLVLDGFLSMNSCESLFWMTSVLALLLMSRGASSRLWIMFGVSSGLGLLNKPSMTFFLAALLVAMLLTPQRRLLRSRWTVAGIALTVCIALPNLAWQVHHQWATFEFLRGEQAVHRGDRLSPLAFLLSQWVAMGFLGILVWLPGLVWLVRDAQRRWLGLAYLFLLGIMMALHAKDYYLAPIYPLLFAAGGVAWQGRLTQMRQSRLFAFPILESALAFAGLLILPITTPLVTPPRWAAYAGALHLRKALGDTDSLLPQYLADRFGWQEEVDTVTRTVASLSSEDRARVRIFCSNYGEAAALEFLGHDLPPVISGHNNYWLWGPQGATGDVLLVLNGSSLPEMRELYRSVDVIAPLGSPYSMPFERRHTIFLARGRRRNLATDWLTLKHYD